jgi:hypothetical protein
LAAAAQSIGASVRTTRTSPFFMPMAHDDFTANLAGFSKRNVPWLADGAAWDAATDAPRPAQTDTTPRATANRVEVMARMMAGAVRHRNSAEPAEGPTSGRLGSPASGLAARRLRARPR